MCVTQIQRYLMYISYLGNGFRGSQIQNVAASKITIETVQGKLEEALNNILKISDKKPVHITISSRTDRGVHAIKTGVHFDVPLLDAEFLVPESLKKKLNGFLFKNNLNLRILDIIPVSNAFNARFSALEKIYIYRLGVSKKGYKWEKNLLPISEIDRTYFIRGDYFDPVKVKTTLELFEGEKDFSAFAVCLSKYNKSTICKINSFTFESSQPLMPDLDFLADYYDFYQFKCCGNRFLYKMVRRMVGSLLAVGCNIVTPNDIQNMFHQPNAALSSKFPTVPGYALYLSNVTFNPAHMKITKEEKLEKSKLIEGERIKSNISNQAPFEGFKKFLEKIKLN